MKTKTNNNTVEFSALKGKFIAPPNTISRDLCKRGRMIAKARVVDNIKETIFFKHNRALCICLYSDCVTVCTRPLPALAKQNPNREGRSCTLNHNTS